MSKFKNGSLYYTDTDSIFTDIDLNDELVGTELGKYKLENEFKEIVFLGPKIYAGITNNDQYICKIQGFKNSKDVPFETMKSLLYKESSVELNHIKWFKNEFDCEILLKDQLYKLSKSNSKRDFIYDDNDCAYKTEAFKLK